MFDSLFFRCNDDFSYVTSLHRQSIRRISKGSNYTQKFMYLTVFKINLSRGTDVHALFCEKLT